MGKFDSLVGASRGDLKQFLVLTQHFIFRLFQNDMVAFGDQMREKIIGILALLTILCGHVSNAIMFRYALFPDAGHSWVEKCYVITFFMLLIGLIAVFEWDVIFPDARDYLNLIPLPVKIRILFLAKFTSLFLFVALFAVAINAISVFTFAFYLVKWQSQSLAYGLHFMGVHLVSTFGAVMFFFFFNVFIVGLFMNVLGIRLFQRLSVYFRSLFFTFYVFLLLIYLSGNSFLIPSFETFSAMKTHQALFFYVFPPMWFTGLYESLVGNPDLFFQAFVPLSIFALLATLGGIYVTMGLGYRRYMKHMAGAQVFPSYTSGIRAFFQFVLNSVFLRHPVQRAVFVFIARTLKQSMFHKVRLASFLAVAAGMILVQVLPQPEILRQSAVTNRTLLAIPLILGFFLTFGMRGVMQIPLDLEANWVFRLTESERKQHYFSAVRKAIVFLALNPMFMLLLIFYALIWDPVFALLHCSFGWAATVVLMEVLFLKQRKIPFTCSYLPGQERIQLFWLAYVVAFLIYIFGLVSLESLLLLRPQDFLYYFVSVLFIWVSIHMYQSLFYYKKICILYEETPAPVMIGLQTRD
jgi:hypothetical protein